MNWEKEEKKFNRTFYTVLVVSVISTVSFVVVTVLALDKVKQEVRNNGGVGKSIGSFINDVKSEIK